METLRRTCRGDEVKLQGIGSHRSRIVPDLVMCEVLLRLPVKTLNKFQHVCTSWRALISNQYFRESHRKRFSQNPRLLVCTSHPYKKFLTFPLEPGIVRFSSYDNKGNPIDQFDKEFPLGFVHIVATCLDFVCLRDEGNVYLCNPATQQFITLPSPVIMTELKTVLDDQLVFPKYGFGYASSTNEFKVLRVVYSHHLGKHRPADCSCEVFTLGTDHWRPVRVPPFQVKYSETAFFNGAIYMLGNDVSIAYFDGNDVSIAYFNVDQEEWGMLPGPPFSYAYRWQLCIRELSGYLCVTHTCSKSNRMNFWLLKDYDKGEWLKEFAVDLFPLYNGKLAKLIAPLTTKEVEEVDRTELVDANQLVEYVVPLNITADGDRSELVQPQLFLHCGPYHNVLFGAGLYYESILSLGSM